MAKCECDIGYFGTYCDFKGSELPSLRKIATTILNDTYYYVSSKTIEQFDIEIIANVVRALLNHPDIVDDGNFYVALGLLELASGADLYAHQPYDVNVTNIIFEAYANAQMKIAHSFKVRKAMHDNMLLGAGMSLFFYKNSFTLQSNTRNLSIENKNSDYFVSDVNKTNSLISGVLSARNKKQVFSPNETDLYRNWSRRWDATFSQIC